MSRSTPDPYSEQYPDLCTSDSSCLITLSLSSPPLSFHSPVCLPSTCLPSLPSLLSTLHHTLLTATCPTCTLTYRPYTPNDHNPNNRSATVYFYVLVAYLLVCVCATVYEVSGRYRREVARMKLSKVQRQLRYEEQQRKLMKDIKLDDHHYYEDLLMMQKITT